MIKVNATPDVADGDAEQVDGDAVQANTVAAIVTLLEKRTPRFLDTLDTVVRVLKREGLLSAADEAKLGDIREQNAPGRVRRTRELLGDRAPPPSDRLGDCLRTLPEQTQCFSAHHH